MRVSPHKEAREFRFARSLALFTITVKMFLNGLAQFRGLLAKAPLSFVQLVGGLAAQFVQFVIQLVIDPRL